MAKERVRPHRVNLYPSMWRALNLRAAEEALTVSALVRRVLGAYLDGQRRQKK